MVTLTTSICSVLFLVLATSASAGFPFVPQNVYLDTKVGKIKGVLLERPFQDVSAFYRIPFAEPPVGDLRFKRPVPYKRKDDSTIDATSLPKACIQYQPPSPIPPIPQNVQSEDCLYLNVYVPRRPDLRRQTSPRKTVMVWIHGGSFYRGSILDDHSMLASFGDVIVVDVAYRLGVFGFMTIDGRGTNNGLFDQRLGLKWVYDNIDSFGGDKNSITIFGESAGAISVGFHLLSDGSVKYFKRAILESGTPVNVTDDSLNISDVSRLTDCDRQDDQLTLKCLQSVRVDKLKDVQKKLLTDSKALDQFPKLDGDFLKYSINDFYQKDLFAVHFKEILVGVNGVEGAPFITSDFPDLFPWTGQVNKSLTWDNFEKRLKETSKFRNLKDPQAILEAADAESDDSPQIIAEKYSQLVGDKAFVCPALRLVKAFTQESHRSVYFYEYNHRPSKQANIRWPWAKSAVHMEELPVVFGEPFKKEGDWNEDERQLSKSIMSMWTTFAKDGRPKNDSKTWLPIRGRQFGYFKVDRDTSQTFVSGSFPDNKCSAISTLLKYWYNIRL